MKRLDNKIAVITGAGSGIGKVAAEMFANEGAIVLILELSGKAADETATLIKNNGGKAFSYPVDISDEQAIKTVFSEIEKDFNGIDILYNNASVFWGKKDAPLDILDMKVFEKIIKINLFGLVYCSKYAIPLMKKRGGGSIINTGSSASVIGIPECDSYTAAKGATVSLTRSMAVEFGPYNIRTNCICPAAIATPMIIESNLSDPKFNEQAFLDHGTPLKRWGKPEEIASTALFLASTDAAYLNGSIIVADGGITVM